MSLSTSYNVPPRSISGDDEHFRFRSDGGRVARFLLSSDDDDEEEDEEVGVERDDVVVQLPAPLQPPREREREMMTW